MELDPYQLYEKLDHDVGINEDTLSLDEDEGFFSTILSA
jgi:hypothetical protein